MPVAIRILVSAALLGIVLWQVNWRGVLGAVTRAEWLWLSFALLAFNGSMVLASVRWKLIDSASARGETRLPLRTAVAATYVSLWLSNFLPTVFGGDVMRVLTARQAGTKLPLAISNAVLDRYIGLTTLACVFAVSEGALAVAGHSRPWLPAASLFALGFCLLLLLAWKGAHFRLKRRWLRRDAVRFMARAAGVLRGLTRSPALTRQVATASLGATLFGIASYWGAIRSVSEQGTIAMAIAAAAVGTLASAIPISVSGWGVREGAVTLVLTESAALTASDASLVAIFNAIVIAATSLVGFSVSLTKNGYAKLAAQRDAMKRPALRRSQGL